MSWTWKCIGLRRNHPGFTSHSVNCTSDFIQLLLWQVGAKDLTWKTSKPFSALKALFQAVGIFYAYSYLGNTQTHHLKYVNVYETSKGAPHIYILKPSYLMNFMTHTCSNSLAVRNVCIYFFFSLSKNIFLCCLCYLSNKVL